MQFSAASLRLAGKMIENQLRIAKIFSEAALAHNPFWGPVIPRRKPVESAPDAVPGTVTPKAKTKLDQPKTAAKTVKAVTAPVKGPSTETSPVKAVEEKASKTVVTAKAKPAPKAVKAKPTAKPALRTKTKPSKTPVQKTSAAKLAPKKAAAPKVEAKGSPTAV
jgi:histone H1/5